MHFLLLGASGRTGQLVLFNALAKDHKITALVRNPSTFSAEYNANPNFNLVKGTPTSPEDLKTALTSTLPIDAVIITLAVTRTSDSPFAQLASPRFLIRDTIRALLPQMKERGVRKLVVMSTFGSGSSWTNFAWPLQLVFKYTNMSYVLEDHNAVDQALRQGEHSDWLEWAMVKPAMLKDGDAKPVREFGETGDGVGMLANVTRESVAEVLIKAAEGQDWNNQAVVIAN